MPDSSECFHFLFGNSVAAAVYPRRYSEKLAEDTGKVIAVSEAGLIGDSRNIVFCFLEFATGEVDPEMQRVL